MLFTVNTESGKVNLDKAQLVDMLLAEVLESSKATPRADMLHLAVTLNELLQGRSVYTQMTLDQITLTAFSLGYYYNRFLELNEVQVTDGLSESSEEDAETKETNAEDTSSNIHESASEDSPEASS